MCPRAAGLAAVRVGIIALGISDGLDFVGKPVEINSVSNPELVCMLPRVDLMMETGVQGCISIHNVILHLYLSLDVSQAGVLN